MPELIDGNGITSKHQFHTSLIFIPRATLGSTRPFALKSTDTKQALGIEITSMRKRWCKFVVRIYTSGTAANRFYFWHVPGALFLQYA